MFSQFRRSRSRILVTWDKVRVPAGEDILVLAVGLARDKPLTLRNPISKNYSRVVSIAAHLQNLRPGDYINLPVARLGEILGVNDRTISYYLQRGTRDGYLTRIARHHQPSGTAAKYTLAHGSSKLRRLREWWEHYTARQRWVASRQVISWLRLKCYGLTIIISRIIAAQYPSTPSCFRRCKWPNTTWSSISPSGWRYKVRTSSSRFIATGSSSG